jgi:hypothetical protein
VRYLQQIRHTQLSKFSTYHWVCLLNVVIFAGLDPQHYFDGKLSADDGPEFLFPALADQDAGFLRPAGQNFHLLARLIGMTARILPLEWVPTVYAWGAMLGCAAAIAYVTQPEFDTLIPGWRNRFGLNLLLVIHPSTAAVVGLLGTLQYPMVFFMALVILRYLVKPRPQYLIGASFLTLSSPLSFSLIPLLGWFGVRRKDFALLALGSFVTLVTVMNVVLAVHGSSWLKFLPGMDHLATQNIHLIPSVFWHQGLTHIFRTLIGSDLLRPAIQASLSGYHIALIGATGGIAIWAWRRFPEFVRNATPLLWLYLGATLLMCSLVIGRNYNAEFIHTLTSGLSNRFAERRHHFFADLVMLLFWVSLISRLERHFPRRRLISFFAMVFLLQSMMADVRSRRYLDISWVDQVAAINAAKATAVGSATPPCTVKISALDGMEWGQMACPPYDSRDPYFGLIQVGANIFRPSHPALQNGRVKSTNAESGTAAAEASSSYH